jgi:predicted nucleic acid-binding protein
MALRREIGRPMSVVDGQIAAVARSRGCALVTRNVTDFEDCDLELINPWLDRDGDEEEPGAGAEPTMPGEKG